jgi:hypothetical protein
VGFLKYRSKKVFVICYYKKITFFDAENVML